MIAVDTNVLVYAHRSDSEWHIPAAEALRSLAQGAARWAIPWPCVHEFMAIVTHPRIYSPPSALDQALDQVTAWLESPTISLIGESGQHWELVSRSLLASRISGPGVHDARVAAICEGHGVTMLWTADRDFHRFPRIRTENPLIES